MTTIYLTRYALTSGVQRFDWVIDYSAGRGRVGDFTCGKDLFFSRAEAITRAEKMRTAKIASLKKQIARLEALTFEVEG
jgi:hypothetical protein